MKKNSLLPFMFIFLFSCNVTNKENEIISASIAVKSLNDLSPQQRDKLVVKIRNNDNFELFIRSFDKFNEELLSKRLSPLIKDERVMKEMNDNLKHLSNDNEARVMLGKMFSNSFLITEFYDSMRTYLNTNNMRKDISDLKYLSDVDIAALYSDATDLIYKERFSKSRTTDCAGQCSESLNIDISWAQSNLYYAASLCGLLTPTVIGALACAGGAIGAYAIYISQYAIPNFESCWGECVNQL